jgi:hypothetical protein
MRIQEFYGKWIRFGGHESACLAAVAYLEDSGLIVVHDTNGRSEEREAQV